MSLRFAMETWFIIVVSLCVCALLRPLLVRRRSSNKKLPPGPSSLASSLVLLTKSFSDMESILRDLKSKYGPLLTLSFGSRCSIFIGSHSLAHQVLIQNGAVFSDRPSRGVRLFNISSSSYGPTWRLLRRNLASEILHPSRIKSYSWARQWVLQILIGRLLHSQEATAAVMVVDHFQYAMFCLLVLMCFGDKLDEHRINEIERVQRRLLLGVGSGRFNIFNFFPRIGKILFRNRWKELQQLRQDQEQVLVPLINARIRSAGCETPSEILAYVDTLVNLQLPEEEARKRNGNGKLTDKDMVSMCSEFLNAGTDTTSTALQWIMANLVKYPDIQEKLYKEITGIVGATPAPLQQQPGTVINEEDLEKMPYLKAVVLEGLRRHPPAHFVLPHRVTEDVELQGYVVPQGATINFMVADMGWDPTVWDNPMEFKPARFLFRPASNGVEKITSSHSAAFDITGSKEIKMMPFGAGRRICPGSALALLHLEYFVANLIWYFQWTAPDGDEVDLSEKQEFTMVMKNPLRAHISSRAEQRSS